MVNWIDSHCHLDSIDDVKGVVGRARDAGVIGMVTVGTDLETSRRCIEVAASTPGVWATVGIHPSEAEGFSDGDLAEVVRLAAAPEVVAVGEVGLDFYRDFTPREDQHRAFRAQIHAAKDLGKTLVLHVRDALDDVFEVLAEERPPERLVFHCFSGGAEEAQRALDLGGHVSFAGNVSYKSAETLREAARVVPLDRLLVETDSPYLAPVPYRGRPNEPAHVVAVGAALASATGRSLDEIGEATAANARAVFRLDHSR